MEVLVAGNQGSSWKVKGTPAQQRIVLSNMPIALALSNRTAYPIPTPTKLFRYLSLHSPKVQNKLTSSRWHWPSLDSFSLFIRQTCIRAHRFEEEKKCPLPRLHCFYFENTTTAGSRGTATWNVLCCPQGTRRFKGTVSCFPLVEREAGIVCSYFTIASLLNSLSSLISLWLTSPGLQIKANTT